MADLPSRQELFDRWRDGALTTPGTRISAREIDREGSDLNLQGAAMSLMGEEIVRRMARALAGVFEDTSEGDALDRVVFDRKGLPRLPISPSVGAVQLVRPTFAAGAGTIPGGDPGTGPPSPTRIRTNRGIVYSLTENAIFGATTLSVTADVQAELAGLAQEVDELQSWSFVDTPFDETITIANAAETAGASDEEADPNDKSRAKAFFPTIRRGTLGAIEFGFASTPGIASVSVIEVIAAGTGLPACFVQGFILDALDQGNETLAARGLLNQLEFRCAGIPVQAIAGTPQFVNVDFVGTSFDTSIVLDTSQAADDVRSFIVAALLNQRPGQILQRATIIAAAKNVPGFVIEDSDLVEPAGALIPASSDIAFRTLREKIQVR